MRRNRSGSGAPKGKAPEMDWNVTDDPNNVAEEGWEHETQTPWTCTTCKKYVKMSHLMKLWPRAQAMISGPRREGPTSSCLSNHFRQRYHEVTIEVGVQNSRPEIMLYSNMAMVWAEIVLHKDVDWSTVAGLNVRFLNRTKTFIDTKWVGPSDCMALWSNRRAPDNDRSRSPPSYRGAPQRSANNNRDNSPWEQYDHQELDVDPWCTIHGYGGSTYGGYNSPPQQYPDYGQYNAGNPNPPFVTGTYPRGTYGGYTSPPPQHRSHGQHHGGSSTPPFHRGGHPGSTYGGYNTPPQQYHSHGQHHGGSSSPPFHRGGHPGSTYGGYNTPPQQYHSHGQHHGGSSSPPFHRGGYARSSHDTRGNSPPFERRRDGGSDVAPSYTHGYGGSAYGGNNTPRPSFQTTREKIDAEYERQLSEATRQSQEEYIRKLEEENRFYQMHYDPYHESAPRGQYSHEAGPSHMNYDSYSSDD